MGEIVRRSHSNEALVSISQLARGDAEPSSALIAASAVKIFCALPIGRQSTECVWHSEGMAAPLMRPWEALRIGAESGQQMLHVERGGVRRSQLESRKGSRLVGRSGLARRGCDVDSLGASLGSVGAFWSAHAWCATVVIDEKEHRRPGCGSSHSSILCGKRAADSSRSLRVGPEGVAFSCLIPVPRTRYRGDPSAGFEGL
jgi:hypothetical protein